MLPRTVPPLDALVPPLPVRAPAAPPTAESTEVPPVPPACVLLVVDVLCEALVL
jgi:hypothetical protein